MLLVLLVVTGGGTQGPDKSKEVIHAHHHVVDQGEPSHDQLLPQSLAAGLWPHEFDFARLDHSPEIRREPGNWQLVLVDADKVPRLEPAVAGPGHRDGLVSVGHGERAVRVHSAEAFLRDQGVSAAVDLIVRVDVEEMQSARADDLSVVGAFVDRVRFSDFCEIGNVKGLLARLAVVEDPAFEVVPRIFDSVRGRFATREQWRCFHGGLLLGW
jgi:hypothetical protein